MGLVTLVLGSAALGLLLLTATMCDPIASPALLGNEAGEAVGDALLRHDIQQYQVGPLVS